MTQPAGAVATPEKDAPKAPEVKIGTTARLFPELVEPETPEKKPDEPKVEKPAVPAPDYLDTEALKGKKVKIKADGAEAEVSFEELHKNFQTDRSLTQRAQKLAEERRLLEEEKRKLSTAPKEAPVKPKKDDTPEDPMAALLKPHLEPILAENARLKAELDEIKPILTPIQQEKNLEVMGAYLKTLSPDYGDFVELFKKGEITRLAVELDPDHPERFDTKEGVKELYFVLKTRQAAAKAAEPKTPKDPETPKKAPPTVEGGGGGPSGVAEEERRAAYQEAVKRAKKSGSMDDWAEVMRLQNAPESE